MFNSYLRIEFDTLKEIIEFTCVEDGGKPTGGG